MVESKTPVQGFGEAAEADVLHQIPEDERVWFADRERLGWVFCVGLSRYASERSGRKTGAMFRLVTPATGKPNFECRLQCSVGSKSVTLTSGPCGSSREAFERAMGQAAGLPFHDELNWQEALREKVPFDGMRAPKFVNSVAIGMPAIVCSLHWGNREHSREVHSSSHVSRVDAFNDAIELALAMGPAPAASLASVKQVPSARPIAWVSAVRSQTGDRLGGVQVSVDFLAAGADVICRIDWGNASRRSVQSQPKATRVVAFDQAMLLLKRTLVESTNQDPPVVVPRPKSGPMGAQDRALLSEAKERWGVERAWLMRLHNPSTAQIQRLHDLNTFQVLLDSLRCYEIDRGARDVALGRITRELQRIHGEQTDSAKRIRFAASLRALLGKRFAEAGEAVTLTPSFANQVMSRGYPPDIVIQELVKEQLLRLTPTGTLSVSTLGANLLERHIGIDVSPGSVGSSLPQGVMRMLLELKDAKAEGAAWI